MPKDKKLQEKTNKNTAPVQSIEEKRAYRKNIKNLVYKEWEEKELQKIDAEVQKLQEAEDKQINAKKAKIDKNAVSELEITKRSIARDWRDHLIVAHMELTDLDAQLKNQMNEAFQQLEKEYAEKESDAERKHRETLQNIESDREKAQEKVDQERAQLKAEIEKSRKELVASIGEINKIGATIAKFVEKGNKVAAKGNKASVAVQREMQEKISEQQAALVTANEKSRKWDAVLKELQKQEQELDKALEPFKKQKKEEDQAYKRKLEELLLEKSKKQAEEQQKARAEKEKKQKEYDIESKWEYQPHRWDKLSSDILANAEFAKKELDKNRTAKADEKKKQLTAQMHATGAKLLKRLQDSVDFDIELDKLDNSAKSNGKGNTAEFKDMITALRKAGKAVDNGEVSPAVDAEIRKSCLEAYQECRKYLKKKERSVSFFERFRSQTGKDRIRMAQDMMDRLKTFYPGLETALRTGRIPQDDMQEEKTIQRPQRKAHTRDTGKVKRELDAAKKELREKNGMQNGNTGSQIRRNTAQQTKQQAKQVAK